MSFFTKDYASAIHVVWTLSSHLSNDDDNMDSVSTCMMHYLGNHINRMVSEVGFSFNININHARQCNQFRIAVLDSVLAKYRRSM